MKMFSQYKGLPRQMYYLSTVKLINEIAISFIFPFLSLICTERLGFSTVVAAFLVSLTAVGNIIGSLAGGKLADEWGRRKTFDRLAIVMIICMSAAGFVCTHRIVIVLLFICNLIASAVVPVTAAMVIDISPVDKRNESFSLLYIFSNIGTAIGPVMAGLLFYKHMPWTYYCVAIFYTMSLAIMFFRIKETYTGVRNEEAERLADTEADAEAGAFAPGNEQEPSMLAMVLRHHAVLIFVICMFFVFICYTEISYVLPLQFSDAVGLDLGSKLTSAIWSVNGVVVIILTPLLMLFIKKHRPLLNVVMGCMLYVVGFGLYALPIRPALALCAVVVWTCGEIFINTESVVYLAEVAPSTHRGRVVSLFSFVRAAGKLIGPILCSLLLLRIDYGGVWKIISAICLVVSAALFILYRHEAKKADSTPAVLGEE